MESASDPVQIVFCGGSSTGKTSLFQRLTSSSPVASSSTQNVIESKHLIQLKNGINLKLTVYDIPTFGLSSKNKELKDLLHSVDGALLVLNVTSRESLIDATKWIKFIDTECKNSKVLKYLLANKSDLPLISRVITPQCLETFARSADFVNWGYTVGDYRAADVDYARGSVVKQKCVEEIFVELVRDILMKRYTNFYKLFPVPFKIVSVEKE